MGPLSNKLITLVTACVLFSGYSRGQAVEAATTAKDYKDPKTHEKFKNRRFTVAAWQINQLKQGALVVRLKTNQTLIDALRKEGNSKLADEREAEQYLINKFIVRSYLDHYKFSKVYFMFSHFTDSLLNGKKEGIFVDSLLNPVAGLRMNENFYLIAERDHVYNSSIGFVREDSARSVVEAGNPTREMAVVVKNKYNHQLKAPFPYYVQDKTFTKAAVPVPIPVKYKGRTFWVPLAKELTYEKFSVYVQQFSEDLKRFHQSNPNPEGTAMYEDAKPFLY